MTQKQYADMTIIMELSRTFADQMYKAMKNCGLIDKGFKLTVQAGDNLLDTGTVLRCNVALEKEILKVPLDEYQKNYMFQWRRNDEGWTVCEDPRCKQGDIPPVVRSIKKEAGKSQERKATGTETPCDGLWISIYDDYLPMDGGM